MLLVVGLSGAVGIVLGSSRQERVSQELTPAVFANLEAIEALVDAETGVRGFLLGGPDLLGPYEGSRARASEALDRVERLAGDVPGVDVARAGAEGRRRRLVRGVRGAARRRRRRPRRPRSRAGCCSTGSARPTTTSTSCCGPSARTCSSEATGIRRVTVAVVAALALLAAVLGGASAVRAVRWTVVPTERLRRVVERLRMGESTARARVDEGPDEVRSVARAVNTLADDADRLRAEREEAARLRQLAVEVGRAVRSELDADEAMLAAVTGLGAGGPRRPRLGPPGRGRRPRRGRARARSAGCGPAGAGRGRTRSCCRTTSW